MGPHALDPALIDTCLENFPTPSQTMPIMRVKLITRK